LLTGRYAGSSVPSARVVPSEGRWGRRAVDGGPGDRRAPGGRTGQNRGVTVVDLKIVARIAVVGVRHAGPCTATAIFVAVICFGCGRSQPATQPPGQSSASAQAAQPAPDTARLIRELTSPDVYTRRNAAQDLASLGPAAEPRHPPSSTRYRTKTMRCVSGRCARSQALARHRRRPYPQSLA